MNAEDLLAEQFEAKRDHLRGVAYRMLGSLSEAEDAVQESWLRLSRSNTDEVENLGGWLTTVTARVCLDMLRSRKSRREDPLETYVPDPIMSREDRHDPEQEALLADSVGLALLVVLETLEPAERLALVLHDMFALPFDDIAPVVGRSSEAARQLASRARRRVQGTSPVPDADRAQQGRVVDAFMAASRDGDFDALVAVLDPDVLLRVDYGVNGLFPSKLVRGAANVAGNALMFSKFAPTARRALVNGSVGIFNAPNGIPMAIMGFTIAGGKVIEIDILADPARLRELDVSHCGLRS
ncbi:MAG: sigma-70 family RNA polymerase sigma factor [Kineosporiaceae bacterium]|nr:sigma-70 family RNA polymerase sigma factor [Aeromicrobium sp.]